MLSDLQVFRNTVNHRRPERWLYYFTLTDDIKRRLTSHIDGQDFNTYYGLLAPVDIYPKRPACVQPPDYSAYWQNRQLAPGAVINSIGVAEVPSGYYHFWGYVSPLQNASSLKDIEDYPIEDMTSWDMSWMANEVQIAHSQGKVARGWVGHIYENAWQIRGYEEFLMDLIDRPAWARCLLDKLARQCMIRAQAYAAAGVDWIMCGDDVGNQNSLMFPPPVWESEVFSNWKQIWQKIKTINKDTRIWYHSDGNIIEIIGKLVDAGLDILNPLQPECLDIDAIYRDFGNHLVFDGCVGTQTTMPFGSPRDVKARVDEVICKYGRSGGLILSPTHILEPEVPIENIEAFCDACRNYKVQN